MIECSNAEIRDQLPELVNGQLVGESLVTVRAHVAGCSPCQTEVQLLEKARAVLFLATPRIDTARIAQRLPSSRIAPRSRFFDWRIAATIAVLAVGGGGSALMYNGRSHALVSDTIALSSVTDTEQQPELPLSMDVSGLSDDQLRELVGSTQKIEALPAAEPSVPLVNVSSDTTGAW
jgi:hypothetical protein